MGDPRSGTQLIDGLGPAAAARLEEHGIVTASDLLRATADDVFEIVAELAPREEVQRWRSMAALLQVAGMTSPWAAALVRAGFRSVEELAGASSKRVREAIDEGGAAGVVADRPDAAALAELRLDAVRLHHTGALNVTVGDDEASAIEGARLTLGGLEATTDSYGRARFNRVPLGQRMRLIVEADGYDMEVVDDIAPLLDERAVGTETIVLFPSAPGDVQSIHLVELDGDSLPPMSVRSMASETRPADQLREGDVLMMRRIYSKGESVQLTSKFLEYRDGTYYAISYRVPTSELPAGTELRMHVRRANGGFQPVHVTPRRLAALKAQRRARRATAGSPPAQTIAEKEVRMSAYEEAYRLELARGSLTRGAPIKDEDGSQAHAVFAEPAYCWHSSGGCELCDALDGHQCEDGDLPRPHVGCDCVIIDRSRAASTRGEASADVELRFAQCVHQAAAEGRDTEELELLFEFRIHCPGQPEVLEGEVTLARTYGEWRSSEDFLESAYEEAYDRVLEITASECPPCGPPEIV